MRRTLAVLLVTIAWPGLAGALDCPEWLRLTPDQKAARIERKTESHLNSNVSQRYTSENSVAMRRCMERFAGEIADQFDAACEEGRTSPKALDDLFDKYFLSCVQ